MRTLQSFLRIFLFVFFLAFYSTIIAQANNLTVSDVRLEERNPALNTVVVKFNVSWENSWKSKINHDAIWLTVRLYNPSATPTEKKLCQLSLSGLNPTGMSAGSGSPLELYVPADKTGVFLRPSQYGSINTVTSEDISLTIDYTSGGFTSEDIVNASVVGIEMVLIPEGAFYAGDYGASSASLNQGSSDTDPWFISGESALAVTNPSSNGYRYVSAGNGGEDATGTAFTLSANYPKGYKSFYVMKYEVTEGQWVEFFNSLSSNGRSNHDLTDATHKNMDTVSYRNTISCSGSPLVCSTSRPTRALNYLSWMDLAAFLDWAALRPMTELEYEKMSRGPSLPVQGEFVWGSTTIAAASTISSGDEDGAETIADVSANANYNNSTLSGGDTGNGVDYTKGPLRSGIFATSTSDREKSGAGYYGVMELSGNVSEFVVTIGNASGRGFIASLGDGKLTTADGYQGNANQSDWPGMDTITVRGITGANGSGFKGGAWEDSSDRLRISDRQNAANASTEASKNYGGRGVRTYDGN